MMYSIRTAITVGVVLVCVGCLQHGAPSSGGQIRFQVVDQYSKPFPGIPVRLLSSSKNAPDRALTTDAQGEGTFSGLSVGAEYVLRVEPPVGMQLEAVEKAGDNSTPLRQYRLLDLRAGVPIAIRDPTAEEENICEVVFRAFINTEEFGFKKRTRHYYLTLLGKDPSQEFLNRFRKENARVHRGSLFDGGGSSTQFSIYYIAWESESRVEVAGGYYSGIVASDGRTLILIKENGVWTVVSNVQNWES